MSFQIQRENSGHPVDNARTYSAEQAAEYFKEMVDMFLEGSTMPAPTSSSISHNLGTEPDISFDSANTPEDFDRAYTAQSHQKDIKDVLEVIAMGMHELGNRVKKVIGARDEVEEYTKDTIEKICEALAAMQMMLKHPAVQDRVTDTGRMEHHRVFFVVLYYCAPLYTIRKTCFFVPFEQLERIRPREVDRDTKSMLDFCLGYFSIFEPRPIPSRHS
jgi:hypothetical protein